MIDPPADQEGLDREPRGVYVSRLAGVVLLLAITAASPLAHVVSGEPPGLAALGVLAVAAAVILACRILFLRRLAGPWPTQRMAAVAALVALATALAAWQASAIPLLALSSAAIGLRCPPRLALPLIGLCAALALALAAAHDQSAGTLAAETIATLAAGLITFGAARRQDTIAELRATRRDLARLAVAEERVRIARDLHDLVGHSLSVIALKSELARRVLPDDPDRAAGEIADVEAVARRALQETRQAVTGYRRPTLAVELASARRAMASAGIDVRVDAPEDVALPAEVDETLAWAVREATTNLLRHSAARHAVLRVTLDAGSAAVEAVDDGVGPGAGSGSSGSGLAGLAERAARLGGHLDVGAARPRGFRLEVRVPASAP